MRYDANMKKQQQPHTIPLTLLGGLSAEQFLAEYWQKKPLLIRQAIPDFNGLLSPNELAGLSCEEEVQARLVSFQGGQWHVENGPFEEERFARLSERDWTLLVQGVNHYLPEAEELLQQFSFVPYARLDDLMVSFAPDEGGVGPRLIPMMYFSYREKVSGYGASANRMTCRWWKARRCASCNISMPSRSGCWNRAICSICRHMWRIGELP